MNFVCEHADELDLEISKQQSEKCASGYLARKGLKRRTEAASAAPSILQRMFGSTMAAGGEDDVDMNDC